MQRCIFRPQLKNRISQSRALWQITNPAPRAYGERARLSVLCVCTVETYLCVNLLSSFSTKCNLVAGKLKFHQISLYSHFYVHRRVENNSIKFVAFVFASAGRSKYINIKPAQPQESERGEPN